MSCFHFVARGAACDDARYDLLVGTILEQGALRHWPYSSDGSQFGYSTVTTDGTWLGNLETETHGPDGPMMYRNIVCFADIPPKYLALHMKKYSRFGLSFSKPFLAERGARLRQDCPSLADKVHEAEHLGD